MNIFLGFLYTAFLLFASAIPAHGKMIGKLTKFRGRVTVLPPRSIESVAAKVGLSLGAEASLLTGQKSFAIVRYNSGTQLIIGPNSKVVLMPVVAEKSNIINLLKGKIKATVLKKNASLNQSKKDLHRFYIKTKTAALGVRGTHFQSTFNPENQVTSLLTFSGEVAMAKRDPQRMAKRAVRVREKPETKQEETGLEALEPMEKILKGPTSVIVGKGHYSGVVPNLKMATAPIKISPIQFTHLKLNKTFIGPGASKLAFKKELEKTKKFFGREQSNALLERAQFDGKTGRYRGTSGGHLDLKTGLYVPPSSYGKFNKELNVFEMTSDRGRLSKQGGYLPPTGLLLDASRGFVIDPKKLAEGKGVPRNFKALNEGLSHQLSVPKKAVKPNLEDINDTDSDAYKKYFKIPK